MKKIITSILVLSLALTSIFTINVFAKKQSTYAITFDFNGGTFGAITKKFTIYNTRGVAHLPGNVIKKPGYWFAGFYTKKSKSSKKPKGTFVGVYNNYKKPAKSNKTYYAHWVKIPRYKISIKFKNGRFKVKGTRRACYPLTHGRGGLYVVLKCEDAKISMNRIEKKVNRKTSFNVQFSKNYIKQALKKKKREMPLPPILSKKVSCKFHIWVYSEDSAGYPSLMKEKYITISKKMLK